MKPKPLVPKILFLMLILLLGGCGLDPHLRGQDSTIQAQTEDFSTSFDLQSVRWETTGGGELIFEISPLAGTADFSIQVSRYQMKNRFTTLRLNASEGGPVFDFVLQLFKGGVRVASGNPCQGICGSWTQATTRDPGGIVTDFTSPTVRGNPTPNPFDSLYQWVVARLK